MKTSSQVVKHSKILWIILILFLSSCNKSNEEKPLEILHSEKSFFIYTKNNPNYVSIEGIWQVINSHDGGLITNYESINYPHSVKISCDKDTRICDLQETIIGAYNFSQAYYFTSNTTRFTLKTWDKDKIIAIQDSDLCLIRILQIDLHTQEVFIKSVLKDAITYDKYCTSYKGKPMPIVHKLVDESESDWEYSISLTKKPKKKNDCKFKIY